MPKDTRLERHTRQQNSNHRETPYPGTGKGKQPLLAWFAELGFDGTVSRLDPGRMRLVRSIVERAGLTVACIEPSGAIEFAGRSPAERVTLLLPRGEGTLWVNGRHVGGRGVISLPPAADVLALFRGGSRVLVVSIPAEPRDCGAAIGHALSSGDALADVVTSECPDRDKAAYARSLADDLVARAAADDQARAETAYRILVKARAYIEAHLGRRIRMTDLCEHAATSLSRLERTFRREMDLSPTTYLLAVRLEAVRRSLQSATSPQASVARLAHDCGFNHLGRFAAAYRRHFGELPSQTLRARLQAQA